MSKRVSPEEQQILDRIILAKQALAAKLAPPRITVTAKLRPPGLVALFDNLSCEKCKRNIAPCTRYVLVRAKERRLRYHEGTCAPKEITDGTT